MVFTIPQWCLPYSNADACMVLLVHTIPSTTYDMNHDPLEARVEIQEEEIHNSLEFRQRTSSKA